MKPIAISTCIVVAVLIARFLWFSPAALHRAARHAGPEKARELVAANPSLRRRRESARRIGTSLNDLAQEVLGTLPSSCLELAGWALVAILAGACWVFTANYLSAATLGGDHRQALMFGIALPTLAIAAHLTDIGRKAVHLQELPKLSEAAARLLKRTAVGLAIATGLFNLAKFDPKLPDWAGLASIALLDVALALMLVALVVQFATRVRGPWLQLQATRRLKLAQTLDDSMRCLSNTLGKPVDELWPDDDPDAGRARKSAPTPPPPDGQAPSSVNGAAAPTPAVDATPNANDETGMPYRASRFALAVTLGLGAAIAFSGAAQAAETRIAVDVDTTASVYRPELQQVLPFVAEQIVACASATESSSTITRRVWSGRALEARTFGEQWAVPGYEFRCSSPFKLRCDQLRQLARERADTLRRPVLTDFTASMRNLTRRLDFNLAQSPGSDIGAILSGANRDAQTGVSVVVTDALQQGTGRPLPPCTSRGRVVVVVIASIFDRDEGAVDVRVRSLRTLGYLAVDGLGGARTLPWPSFLASGAR